MGEFYTWTVFVTLVSFMVSINEVTTRVARDVTGHYHGEHHHHPAEPNNTNGNTVFPPNCLCVVKDTGCIGREAYTRQFDRISTLVCGHEYDRCCFEDPWPGVVDNFAGVAPCVPQEECPRYYGQLPTDIRDYGILGPCPGLGAVRCLHHDGGGIVVPVPGTGTIVVPIVPVPETPPSVHYEVPVPATEPPTEATTPTTEPPTEATTPTTVPPPPPPTTVEPPPPPTTVPPPPPPATVAPPPPPIIVPLPPLYDLPPSPPETYGPPEQPPSPAYEPPVAKVDIPEPVVIQVTETVSNRPGPPYLWQRVNPPYQYGSYGFGGYGWPGFGFRLRSRLGTGFGLYG